MEKFPDAKIIITEDLALAFALNDKFLTAEDPEYIATTWFGGKEALNEVDYSPLEDREVIYQPRADHVSYLNAEKIKKKCQNEECASFEISKAVLFMEDFLNQITKDQLAVVSDPFESFLIDYGQNILKTPSANLAVALDHGWQIREYQKWLCEVGLKTEKKTDEVGAEQLFKSSQCPVKPSTASNSGHKTLDALISPENITLAVGETDSGKSLYALSLAVAINNGISMFDFNVNKQRAIYYMDAENSAQRLEERMLQILNAYNVKTPNDEFHTFSGVDDQNNHEHGDMDLLNKEWQSTLLSILPHGCVLIVDNLLTLAKRASTHQNSFEELVQFFRELGRRDISTILIHHNGKSGKELGTSAAKSLCHNVITMHKRNQKSLSPGTNMEVTFAKCKSYPELTDQSFYAHLPYDTNNPLNGKPWVYNSAENGPQAEAKNDASKMPPGLSELEQSIIMVLKQSDVPLKRAAIAKEIDCKSDKLKNPLKRLAESKLIEEHGETPQGRKYSANG
ncbi:AAA family ATPase [Desulfovibrio sp. JC022]|uniref:AAA family ATPase n=1 Tax=Desulfovibrio sp. JC022 TaxID=2593642 RepID=UPI0013D2269B|nr:AAA family ATPase [Desulfovibrio sp. JC022]